MSDQANSLPETMESRGDGRAPVPDGALRVLLVTGMSGAGKTSALKAL
ncbi:MAG: RNase adaptor protein RapZ, partial [Proteobacteria bacterium]|nr:RNase adaptor protein RapZ [Pseudomonadota bacterium]